jgi:hypothetical protein
VRRCLCSSATAMSKRQRTGSVRTCLKRQVVAAHRMNRTFRQSAEMLQKVCCVATAKDRDADAHIGIWWEEKGGDAMFMYR